MTAPLFYNSSGFLGQIIIGLNGITGSEWMTMLVILLLLFVIAAAIRIPLVSIGIVYMPLLIVMVAFTGSDLLGIFGLFLIYLGVSLAELFFTK